MKTEDQVVAGQKIILALSLPLAFLLIISSSTGLINPGIYQMATPNWLAQTVGQDAFDLVLITPVLIVSALYAYAGNRFALQMWAGTMAYIFYTFLIYCFTVEFNILFLPYCFILCFALYSLAWFLINQIRNPEIVTLPQIFLKSVGTYFIIISSAFYLLWLSEIIPANLNNRIPESITDAGLITNPVHVIDLSMFLPLVFVSGLFIRRGNPLAVVMTPVILVFFVLMSLTIAALTVVMMQREAGGSPGVAAGMGMIGLFNLGLLIWFLRSSKESLTH